ncbi:embigin [Thalassophryne amazonica]|uniref:embigin n=1 Tax=Thalassophryne amazonica TaxID=390379 RepID=UPI0014725EA2|nr:embigin [Thalassophryne amazonica]
MSAPWKVLFFQILVLFSSCRNINTETPSQMPSLVLPTTPLPTTERSIVLNGESHTEKIELLQPVNLVLECTWISNQTKSLNITGYWKKDGDVIENSHLTVPLENGQYILKRMFNIVSEENLGNYSCLFENEAKIDFIVAVPQISEARDKPVISYVRDSVVILCKMKKTKPKPNTWYWYKANGTEKEQIDTDAEPHRYEIKNQDWKTKLKVHNLSEADSGMYYCGAVYAISTSMSHVELKVISIHEPLKPFIAIMAEVIVLVTAILLYEKTRSKKDNAEENGVNFDQANPMTQENHDQEGSLQRRQRKTD